MSAIQKIETEGTNCDYADHVSYLTNQYQRILDETGFDELLVHSGAPVHLPFDDATYCFKASPYFRHWVDIPDVPDSYIRLRIGDTRPTLILKKTGDAWSHRPKRSDSATHACFDTVVTTSTGDAPPTKAGGIRRVAYISENLASSFETDHVELNPPRVLAQIDYFRAYKSRYEQTCLRRANGRAISGHWAAADAFRNGACEYDIQFAYLKASAQREHETPYRNIIAIDEHAAILHYRKAERIRSRRSTGSSMLIDAGASHGGYHSDISRTFSTGNSNFELMIAAVDGAQQTLVGEVRTGLNYQRLHLRYHELLSVILCQFNIVNVAPDTCLEAGLSRTFFPHGLGHLIGLQVHEPAGHQTTREGGTRRPDPRHSMLRLTRDIESNQVFTIEPGLYFVPALLEELRSGENRKMINWPAVEKLLQFGGIRIEDNILIQEDGTVQNLTRQAFSSPGSVCG